MTLAHTIDAMRAAWTRDTTETPDVWTPERPSTGHCSVASLIIRDEYGGQILSGRVGHYVDDAPSWTPHQWNVIDGVWIDVTADQFDQPRAITHVEPWTPEPGHLAYVTRLADTLRQRMGWTR